MTGDPLWVGPRADQEWCKRREKRNNTRKAHQKREVKEIKRESYGEERRKEMKIQNLAVNTSPSVGQ
jgi:hypothetical protein